MAPVRIDGHPASWAPLMGSPAVRPPCMIIRTDQRVADNHMERRVGFWFKLAPASLDLDAEAAAVLFSAFRGPKRFTSAR
jgi:hypothetical protein